MDLILWRHAEAEERREGLAELDRALTAKGEKQAARVAAWLDRVLPEGARILSSPARRCEQTALALGRKYKTRPELGPDQTAAELLQAAQWPDARHTVVVVGHQPVLGDVLGQLLRIEDGQCPIRKGAAWWLRSRERQGQLQTLVVAVQPPDFS
ncbi:MAG TPA: histidine phosphatase family protein [Ramlibacter sp.]|nr:histidine phosphatase family protein [Ramlibacter sp.]